MCCRCLIFNLSGPCELLFLLCFIASWTSEVVSVMLCVALLMCLFVLYVVCLTVWRRTITTELSDIGLTMGEAQVIAQDRHRWRRDIVALCPTLGSRG